MATQSNSVAQGLVPRFFSSYMLVPNREAYYHSARIVQLPSTIAGRTLEGKNLFMEALKSTETKKFQVLTGAAKDAWIQERVREGQKMVPPGHYTDKIFILIRVTGIICIFIMASG